MSLSSVCVVTNALRLRKFKPNFKDKFKFNLDKNNYKEDNKMDKKTISIEGMQCNHCRTSVENALNSIDGVIRVDVSLENKNAIIESEKEIDDNKIKEVIEKVGFKCNL